VKVRVKYFARVKEETSLGEEEFELSSGEKLSELLQRVLQKHPSLKSILLDEKGELKKGYQLFKNGKNSLKDEVLSDGDVVAIIPPVAGG
jgi:MoaD family protein